MVVNKLSYPAKENAIQEKINEIIDNIAGSTVDQTYDPTSQAAQSGVAIAGELTKYAQKAVDTDITGVYNFKGQKKIKFTQSSSSDKLGFTLYNNSNVEKGYLEYNPTNTVDSVPLMTLGNYATASAGLTHVGFRKYSSISGANGAYNLLAPLISDAKTPFSLTTTYTNFYLPLGFTDGNTTVKTAKSGLVDISSLLPDVSNFVTNTSLATTLADYQPLLVSGTNIKTINNESILGSGNISIQAGGTVDQTFDGTSTNAQSGVAIAGELGNYVKSENGDYYISNDSSILYLGYISTSTGIINQLYCTTGSISLHYNDDNNGIYNHFTVNSTGFVILDNNGNITLSTSNNNLAINGSEVALKSDIPDISTKQDTLVSGTNIKTVNSTSLLGSGNIDVQPTLVSGTNIKTINNTSLLGSGNIDIQGGVSMTYDSATETLTFG